MIKIPLSPRWQLGSYTFILNPSELSRSFQVNKNDANRADGTYNSRIASIVEQVSFSCTIHGGKTQVLQSATMTAQDHSTGSLGATWSQNQNKHWSEL